MIQAEFVCLTEKDYLQTYRKLLINSMAPSDVTMHDFACIGICQTLTFQACEKGAAKQSRIISIIDNNKN